MNTTDLGQEAESAAAAYLASRGFRLIERNYRTPRCEIDIIAQKQRCVYFVEVKYRSTTSQGAGLDYITTRKQRQMRLAAELWMQAHSWTDDCVLSAIEVDRNFCVTEFIEDIS